MAHDEDKQQAIELLADMVARCCTYPEYPFLDSHGSGTYADAIRFMMHLGKATIEYDQNDRVTGRWKDKEA